jgi:hypothetical protein
LVLGRGTACALPVNHFRPSVMREAPSSAIKIYFFS